MPATDNPLRICDPSLKLAVASRSHPFTPRRAIDPSGHIGSFYDAHTDRVLPASQTNFNMQSALARRRPSCFIKEFMINERSNLLEKCNIHRELRLNVALQTTPATGMGALINYSRPVDKYTRFLCYVYYSRTDYFTDDELYSMKRQNPVKSPSNATHMIVLVNWGIDVVVVVQLPPEDKYIDAIDYVLYKLCFALSEENTRPVLLEEDQQFLNMIVHTEVFSNIPDLARINSTIDFYDSILLFKSKIDCHTPYSYNLYPIEYLCAVNSHNNIGFKELPPDIVPRIENYVFELLHDFRRLNRSVKQEFTSEEKHLPEKLRHSLSHFNDLYEGKINEIRGLVKCIRCCQIDVNEIFESLNDHRVFKLRNAMQDFTTELNQMKKKKLIQYLEDNEFSYENAISRGIQLDDDGETITRKLSADPKYTGIVGGNDHLIKNKQTQWNNLCNQLVKKRERNPHLKLIYVDFCDSSYKMDDFITFFPVEKNNTEKINASNKNPPVQEQSTASTAINILLLGESGVGKSTFINAFVNYLNYDELKQAKRNPIILIPVSFIMAVGDDFREHIVKFGESDSLSNEDHNHLGQSVTQHCKSYVFTLNDTNYRYQKVRIIDTPAIGDTRGVTQDDRNLQHILSYINNLTHLNAVCILLKPNNTRLNIFFRSCLIQLFDLLGENARDKIIFCFTNARSTFYTPGNTSSVLKNVLESFPGKKIPFTKENTFCFDSESFRYLVSTLNHMKFSEDDELKHNESWEKSSKESRHFLQYIRTKMRVPLIPSKLRSMKDAQLKITLMIRPMLESMRNILRNIILLNEGFHNVSIELISKFIKDTTAICLRCTRRHIQVGNFWMTIDSLHVFYNRCRTCECEPSDHYPIDYEVTYRERSDLQGISAKDMQTTVDDLLKKSAEFGDFLSESMECAENDQFLIGLNRMIGEEKEICDKKSPCRLNSSLVEYLEETKKKYERKRQKMMDEKPEMMLDDVYNKIEEVKKHGMIASQMTVVEQWQKFMVKQYEEKTIVQHWN